MQLGEEANLNVKFTVEPSSIESDRLAGLQGSVGETFVRKYYQDQVAEHQSAISLLQRYIAKADNEDVKTFTMKLIPTLRTGLATVKTALANSNATAKRIARQFFGTPEQVPSLGSIWVNASDGFWDCVRL